MKSIPNKVTSLLDADGKPVSFAAILKQALDFSPNGFPTALQRARARVDAALANVIDGGDIVLEDQDYTTAQTALKDVVWALRHPAYIEINDAFGV